MSFPQGCSVSASKKMSRLTPFIHSTDNPAISLRISAALGKDSLIWDLALSSVACARACAWGSFLWWRNKQASWDSPGPGYLSLPVLGEFLYPYVWLPLFGESSQVANQPLLIPFHAGRFASVIASGRWRALEIKEVALSFTTILKSLNIVSSLKISLAFTWLIPTEALSICWDVISPGTTTPWPHSLHQDTLRSLSLLLLSPWILIFWFSHCIGGLKASVCTQNISW